MKTTRCTEVSGSYDDDVCVIYANIGVFLTQIINEVCYTRWYMRCSRMYSLSRTPAILFNPSTGEIPVNCQSAKDINTYFKSYLHVEDLGLPDVDGIRTLHTTSLQTICLTIRTPSLLTILKALNFGNRISLDSQSLWISLPVIDFSKVPHVYITCMACYGTSQQLLSKKS